MNRRLDQIRISYPVQTPCESTFEYLAENNPDWLILLIHSGALKDSDLTFAAEAIGHYQDSTKVRATRRISGSVHNILDWTDCFSLPASERDTHGEHLYLFLFFRVLRMDIIVVTRDTEQIWQRA